MNEERYLILIWIESQLRGSHMHTTTHWRPFRTYLTIKEIVKEHEDQFGSGCIVDIIDVTHQNDIRSVFAENA